MASMLRVVSFNVRRFADAEKADVSAAALAVLARLTPIDILALNEVDIDLRPNVLAQAQEALGLDHCAFFGHVRGVYGNALLSRCAVLHTHALACP
jgi:endonuclease/exonuclease/phosphatase family metal-dependent hydrolase